MKNMVCLRNRNTGQSSGGERRIYKGEQKNEGNTEGNRNHRGRKTGNAGRHLRALMKNRWIRCALVVAVILALLLIAAHLIKNSRFKTYEITELEGGNTGAFQYCGIEGTCSDTARKTPGLSGRTAPYSGTSAIPCRRRPWPAAEVRWFCMTRTEPLW